MNEPALPFDPDTPSAHDSSARSSLTPQTVGFVLLLVGVAAIALSVSSVALLVLMLILCVASAGELFRMVRRMGGRPIPLVGFAVIGGVFALAYDGADALLGGIPAVAAAAAAVSLVVVVLQGRVEGALAGVATTTAISLAIGVLGSFVVAIRQVPGGFRVALTLAMMVVLGDLAASIVGRRFGTRPLAPSIGPDKTWQGLGAGTAGILLGAVIAGATLDAPITMTRALMLGILVAIAVPLGDLSGAMIVRDGPRPRTAELLGRGGVLDRIDGLLFAAPIFYFAYRAMVR